MPKHHKDGHHGHHGTHKHHAGHHAGHKEHRSSHAIKSPHGDPDKGPAMVEGAHHFDKGYTSDHEHFAPEGFPSHGERGNHYMDMNNEIIHRDAKKLDRGKFTKIA